MNLIEKSFWSLFERLRASIAPPELLTPFAALLILRWADQQETDQEAIASFDGTSFSPTLSPSSRWRDFCDLEASSLAHALTKQVVPGIRKSREVGSGALLKRIEHTVSDLARLPAEALVALVEVVRSLPLVTPSDREQVLDAFDSLLAGLEHARGDITFGVATPRRVVDLVVELAAPTPGERIYDPCFGFGMMLTACARRVRSILNAASPRDWLDAQHGAFLGVEINSNAFTVGMARMILAGVDQPALELGNTLAQPLVKGSATEAFDCIVSDPPFGGKVLVEVTRQFPVKTNSSEALFLQHIMASLAPGGRAIIVLPRGAFFRGGADEAVRRLLLEEYHVEAVISLPAGAYLPATRIKTGVLVIRREPPGTNVRFVDVEWPKQAEEDDLEPNLQLFNAAAVAACAKGESDAYETRQIPIEVLLREGATLDPPRQDAALLSFVSAIREADATVPIKSLDEVAEIFSGVSPIAKSLLDRRNSPALIGFLRVTEVQDGHTKPPVRFLTPEAAKNVLAERRLQLGDVVITRSGSIGRVAMIANGAIGCVAAAGLVVLRARSELLAHYLVALLQSAPIRAWITGRARGMTIQHVPTSELRRLEIPIPNLALQDRIVTAHRLEGADASELLLRELTSTLDDPLVKWIESSVHVQHLLAMKSNAPSEQDVLDAIEDVAYDLHNARNREQRIHALSMDLLAWASNLGSALDPLMGLSQMPLSAGRLAVLDVACRGTDRALRILLLAKSTNDSLHLAGEVSRTLLRFFETLINLWAKSFKLVPSLNLPTLWAGTGSAVTLKVRNEGPMPLRNVVIQTPPPQLGANLRDVKLHAKTAYLDAGQEISSTAAVLAPNEAGSLDFVVTWQALQLDGRRAYGEFPLAIEIQPPPVTAPAPPPDLGMSPYIIGSPIDRPEMLYGRDGILTDIKLQLPHDRRANIILLEGNRRTGKTSILKRLETPGELPGWIVVNTNLQGAKGREGRAGVTSLEIFRLLTQDLALALVKAGVPVWLPDAPPPDPKRHFELQLRKALDAYFNDDHPFELYEIYLKTVFQAVAPRRVMLMIDEFDTIQEGIDAGTTSPKVPENLRYLFHRHPELGGILSGSRRLTRLRNEYWSALFGIGVAIRVGPLAEEDARALVTQPVAGRLVFAAEARDRIVTLCACQPFLIQTLCNRIFKEAHARGERTILLDAVERAAAEMTSDNEHFETLWGYARTERRRLILALLCELVRGSEGRPLDAGTLEHELLDRGLAVPEIGLGDDIAHLRELELIALETHDGYQRYRLTSPLLAEWIQRNKDFSDLAQRAISEENAGRE